MRSPSSRNRLDCRSTGVKHGLQFNIPERAIMSSVYALAEEYAVSVEVCLDAQEVMDFPRIGHWELSLKRLDDGLQERVV